MPLNNIAKRIVAVISYFDLFDYPLTAVEIWKWLYQLDKNQEEKECRLVEIIEVLASPELQAVTSCKNGFYFLLGRKDIILTRLHRYLLAEIKFKIALKVARFLRWLAFVDLIAVCNNVGYNNGAARSDIDFFVVTRKGRLWLTRFLVILMTTFLGRRHHGNKIKNRICLSFYTTPTNLDLSNISLKENDPYLAYWFATLSPIYYHKNTWQKFISANQWVSDYLPNFYFGQNAERRRISDFGWLKFSRGFDEFVLGGSIGDWLEKLVKLIQLKRIKKYIGKTDNFEGTEIIISDSILKLHTNDRRQYYRQLWQAKLDQLIF